jgi:putative membrane protein
MRRRCTKCLLLAIALTLAVGAVAHAHGDESDDAVIGPRNWHELSHAWAWEPFSWVGLSLGGAWYAIGITRLWRRAGAGHGIRRWEVVYFASGWMTLFVALVSPLHPWGSMLFSAHMTQHELLMLVAAPLLVLARPMLPMLHALPHLFAHALGHVSNRPWWRTTWTTVSHPLVAWLIHAVVLWGWHAPALFQATQRSEWIHAAQHISFIAAAVLFWWSLIHARRGAAAYGAAVLYMFTTALHSGLLGALLTFTKTVWYPVYQGRTEAWGITALQDQSLGGLIMWVPACTVYIIAGLALFAGWIRKSEQRNAYRSGTQWIAPY